MRLEEWSNHGFAFEDRNTYANPDDSPAQTVLRTRRSAPGSAPHSLLLSCIIHAAIPPRT